MSADVERAIVEGVGFTNQQFEHPATRGARGPAAPLRRRSATLICADQRR